MSSNIFLIGCNYRTSNTGAKMWNKRDGTAIDGDLKTLSQSYIKYLPDLAKFQKYQKLIVYQMAELADYCARHLK